MKKETMRNYLAGVCACVLVLCCAWAKSGAEQGQYDAELAQAWLSSFAGSLSQRQQLNDPQETADPSRSGQYLHAYAFGTVLASAAQISGAQDVLEIELRNGEEADCRGVRVGMDLAEAIGGAERLVSSDPLKVLQTQESGYGWSWAYADARGVYGVEHITYGGAESGAGSVMKEYTLTYVIDGGRISAIRMRIAEATIAQAEDGLRTAEEIASRQTGDIMIAKNSEKVLNAQDMTVMGESALSMPVDALVMRMGEPEQVQSLPQGGGRMLVYDGMAVRLGLDEYTGVEIVRGVSVSSEEIEGPRGLSVGFAFFDAAGLFRCDADMIDGGVLYEEAEHRGVFAVYDDETCVLRYACMTDGGEQATLEIGAKDGAVTYWHLYYESDLHEE